ncbi:YvcK family protein, partial [Klebsiella pneumoniae]|nr:YvcK family protein [Klebsiella pneumoniae]
MIEGETAVVAHPDQIQEVTVRLANARSKVDELGSPITSPRAGREVVSEIMQADMVILGTGSLYTSILPNVAI